MIFNRKDNIFFNKEPDFDDEAFNVWKQELEKELPNFWENLDESSKKF